MSVLVLRLAGPLQSWGARSRFVRRTTEPMPTKSGIIGLLAAARGFRRRDPIEELLALQLAVRTEQGGTMLRDFHTAHHQVSGASMPLSHRYYWADSVFTAYVGGAHQMLVGLADALADPAYPIYLGRRSCVPEGRLVLGVDEGTVEQAVRETPWQAGRPHQRTVPTPTVTLDVQADVDVFPGLVPARQLQDVPLSFDPERRQYAMRGVVDTTVEVDNPLVDAAPTEGHDPLSLAGEFA
ncbi:type I-E CRISPR-associated protein Cas5/CasD [Naumannella sp. ID2617S]|nr:type I-E CRISPR-associated protein Cas5/CasD [Naumannella sp. ID2617S]